MTTSHSRGLIGSVPRTVGIKVLCRSTDGRYGDQSLLASLGKFNGTNTYEVFRRHSATPAA
jgi:hypothetical protein